MVQNASVAGQPGQIRNDDHSDAARGDRLQEYQQARAARIVGRFASVLKDADEFDSDRLRERPYRCRLSVKRRPWV